MLVENDLWLSVVSVNDDVIAEQWLQASGVDVGGEWSVIVCCVSVGDDVIAEQWLQASGVDVGGEWAGEEPLGRGTQWTAQAAQEEQSAW